MASVGARTSVPFPPCRSCAARRSPYPGRRSAAVPLHLYEALVVLRSNAGPGRASVVVAIRRSAVVTQAGHLLLGTLQAGSVELLTVARGEDESGAGQQDRCELSRLDVALLYAAATRYSLRISLYRESKWMATLPPVEIRPSDSNGARA